MLWNTPNEPPLAVVRDLAEARTALEQALARADERTRPGLEEAVRVLRQFDRTDDELLLDWAHRTLDRASVDPERNEVQAIAALRAAVPGMNLRAATALAARVKADAGSRTA